MTYVVLDTLGLGDYIERTPVSVDRALSDSDGETSPFPHYSSLRAETPKVVRKLIGLLCPLGISFRSPVAPGVAVYSVTHGTRRLQS